MTYERECRLCGYVPIKSITSLRGMPRWNHRLLSEAEVSSDFGIEINVLQCPGCGFVCVPPNLSPDYYDDYVNIPSLSRKAQMFQMEQARDFVEQFSLRGARVMEVGCGDGFFLEALRTAGAEVFGIEPSARQRDLAVSRGHEVELGQLSNERRLKRPFDAFVTRQVFEHVEDMRDFLLSIRCNLRLGAHGLVEVPNLDLLAAEARFFDFIPEHINYFSPRTLALVLELAGYSVLEVAPVQEGESLRAYVRWDGLPEYDSLVLRVDTLRTQIETFLADCRSKGRKVAIWGAGGKGLGMMAIADLRHVEMLVDGDPGKVGLYTPVSHLKIRSPAELADRAIDVVIVMAPAYEQEIAAVLRSRYSFSGTIVLAGRGFVTYEDDRA